MNKKLKDRLRVLLAETTAQVDSAFSLDPSFASRPNLVAVRRPDGSSRWQFVALAFSTLADRFFVEVAVSPQGAFPIDRIPLGPGSALSSGVLRFRAAELWGQNKSGGWLILKRGDSPPQDLIMPPEGVFETPEAAMTDVKERMAKWILPYLDKSGDR
ncbi:MAG: hypothetical protein ABIR80_08100 [Opitutaceae bacterium]